MTFRPADLAPIHEGNGLMAPTATDIDEILDLTRPADHESGAAEEPEPELLATEDTWWAHARCNDGSGQLAGMFFSEELQDIARAKNICATCPALIPCLEGALERREPWGVWGGELFVNGKIVAQKRKRGRPPKVRPETEVPQAS